MFALKYDGQGVAIGYAHDPAGTLTQQDAEAALADDLNNARVTRIAALTTEVAALLEAGFTCTNGITMDATTAAMQLLKSGHDLALATNAASIAITDYSNTNHAGVLLADVWQMLIELGGNYQQIRSRKVVARHAVALAVTAVDIRAVAL